ncbi:MAG: hypothetical protein J5643_07405 [Lachnospiraceae bacterium]|nr:hypothetical protein [Lachnospiraceae bacterium]
MKFTQIPSDTFQKMAINAGVIASAFTPGTGSLTASNILGATSGGVSVTVTPNYLDMGEDIDNCPKNTKELKRIKDYDVKVTGTFVTSSPAVIKRLMPGSTIDSEKITPSHTLSTASGGDFDDIWIIGDYSDKNGPTNGGFVACHIINALSTGGFSYVTSDGEKAKFAFEFTGHYSISAPDTVPFEIYVHAGTNEPT